MVAKRILLLSRPFTRAAWPRTERSYATTRQPSATTQFYKTFTRPVAKVTLLAVFTYQVVYWVWVKLEADEIRVETDATIAELEAQVSAHGAARTKEAGKEGGSKAK
ncbi:hypothetical protein HRG_002941 [Hirsutella rhossiliensis]|uniref:Uncharacterized protein n=1 Tax=Hirsutella rhossiliensis TaxID=111463 RepID=A0A9P8SKM3_9HYPO|nr:uncharacterized protein HRG_02941 [Hirsutella rhossiliensis]KAH0964925.1 hypothetical protein HRG_02941 [Hirsutella rhossiliensis]